MRLVESAIEISASDLSRFLGCHHRAGLDLAVAHGRLDRPTWVDPALKVLQERGLEHERQYVDTLAAQGLTAMDLSKYEGFPAEQRTLEAMRAGGPGHRSGPSTGSLVQAPGPAAAYRVVEWIGRLSYEPIDTKLALATHGGTLL